MFEFDDVEQKKITEQYPQFIIKQNILIQQILWPIKNVIYFCRL